jgi:hypothetical protein
VGVDNSTGENINVGDKILLDQSAKQLPTNVERLKIKQYQDHHRPVVRVSFLTGTESFEIVAGTVNNPGDKGKREWCAIIRNSIGIPAKMKKEQK